MVKKILLGILLIVLTIQIVYLVQKPPEDMVLATTEVVPVPGKSYSLLIDDERLPIIVNPGERIQLNIIEDDGGESFSPPNRIVVKYLEGEGQGSKVVRSRFAFRYDTPVQLQELFVRENLDQLTADTQWETVLNVLGWTRDQFPPGTPGEYPSQNALTLLKIIRSGEEKGFCAQYCYILAQALQSMGFYARHVSLSNHEVDEVWLPEEGKWVCLDPLYQAYFTDDQNTPLSCYEVSAAGGNVKIVSPIFSYEDADLLKEFTQLEFWLNNDLFTHPVNLYDLGKYRVHVVSKVEDIENVPAGALFTVYPEELYEAPGGDGWNR